MYFVPPDFSEPAFVATTAGGQTGRVYPLAPLYKSAQLKDLRVNLFLQALTVAASKMQVTVGLQVSVDGVTWDTSITQPPLLLANTGRSQEGPTAVTAFEDVSSTLTLPYARLVLWVQNFSGETAHATCLASIRVERKTC